MEFVKSMLFASEQVIEIPGKQGMYDEYDFVENKAYVPYVKVVESNECKTHEELLEIKKKLKKVVFEPKSGDKYKKYLESECVKAAMRRCRVKYLEGKFKRDTVYVTPKLDGVFVILLCLEQRVFLITHAGVEKIKKSECKDLFIVGKMLCGELYKDVLYVFDVFDVPKNKKAMLGLTGGDFDKLNVEPWTKRLAIAARLNLTVGKKFKFVIKLKIFFKNKSENLDKFYKYERKFDVDGFVVFDVDNYAWYKVKTKEFITVDVLGKNNKAYLLSDALTLKEFRYKGFHPFNDVVEFRIVEDGNLINNPVIIDYQGRLEFFRKRNDRKEPNSYNNFKHVVAHLRYKGDIRSIMN